jgi:hypothetical protein
VDIGMRFPDGRRFAFTILDDTDDSTLENVRPVYDRLRELGLRTTKTVWPVDCPEGSRNYFAADTLARPAYLEFVKQLVADGFELASHGATMESSPRERTQRALAFLQQHFGALPRLHANHGENRENLYWGLERFQSPPVRALVRIVGRHPRGRFAGERPESPYYWGDLFVRHFEYLRNFTFSSLDMQVCNPEMPYRLASTPEVGGWFSTSDVPDLAAFRRLVTRARLEALERRGGVCILSTHLGKGFARDGRLDPVFDETLQYIASRPGWFVPVSTLLDHLRAERRRNRGPEAGQGSEPTRGAEGSAKPTLAGTALMRLELRFLAGQLMARLHEQLGR